MGAQESRQRKPMPTNASVQQVKVEETPSTPVSKLSKGSFDPRSPNQLRTPVDDEENANPNAGQRGYRNRKPSLVVVDFDPRSPSCREERTPVQAMALGVTADNLSQKKTPQSKKSLNMDAAAAVSDSSTPSSSSSVKG